MGSIPKNISASRGAAVLGLSKWTTQIEVWLEIMESRSPGFAAAHGYELPERTYSAAMRWGHAFEDAVIELSEQKAGCKITDMERSYNALDGVVTCHVDGRYMQKRRGLHEGKTTNLRSFRNDWGEPGTNQIPRQYMIQVQHQMMCARIDRAIVSVLIFPMMQDEYEKNGLMPVNVDDTWVLRQMKDEKEVEFIRDPIVWARTLDDMGLFKQYEINADNSIQTAMAEAYLEYWNEYVLGEKPPTMRTYSDIKRMIRAPSGTIVADAKLEDMSSEYKAITDEMGQAKKRKDELKTEILKRMNEKIKTEDEENADRWVLVSDTGRKLHSYNGKMFR